MNWWILALIALIHALFYSFYCIGCIHGYEHAYRKADKAVAEKGDLLVRIPK